MELDPFSLPLRRPLGTAHGEITAREGFLVEVRHAGESAVGEATPLPGWTESLEDCRTALAAVEDPVAALESGAFAETPAARHAVASAVATCEARAAGASLAEWLADECPVDSVPVNATVGDGDPEETVRTAREAVADGFSALKVKVGARDPAADRERLAAVRAACPEAELRADANGAWDRETAAAVLEWAAELDLAYVEQPLPASDLAGHAALRGHGVSIALDEGLTEYDVATVLDADAADLLVLKPMALGGPLAAREAALAARDAGGDAIVTTTIDGAYARAVAVHLAASLPDVSACGLATADLLAADLRDPDPVPVEGGLVQVPDGPGLF